MLIDYVHVDTSNTDAADHPAGRRQRAAVGLGQPLHRHPRREPGGRAYGCRSTTATAPARSSGRSNSNGTATALGKCMDAAAAGTANGTAIQLYTCNGTGAQKFALNAAGALVNSASGKCVDVVNNGTANGSQLQLWTCTGGSQPEMDQKLI